MKRKPPVVGLLKVETPPVPPPQGVASELLTLIPALREQRGTWFRVGEFYTDQGANSARRRVLKHESAQDVEWRGQRVDGGSILWARYIGKEHRTGKDE